MLLLISISQSVNSQVCKAWQWLKAREVNINTKWLNSIRNMGFGWEILKWRTNVYAHLRDISSFFSLGTIFQCLFGPYLSHLCFFFPSVCLYNLSSLNLFCFSSFIVPITPHLLLNLSHLPPLDIYDIIPFWAELSSNINLNLRMILPL